MKKDKNKKTNKNKSLVEVAQELGGVVVRERPCYKNYECEECGINYADYPSKLCPGCEAYLEHLDYL